MTFPRTQALVGAALLAALAGGLSSCEKPEEDPIETKQTSVSLKTHSSIGTSGSTFVTVSASGDWKMFVDPAVSWARLSDTEGTGDKCNIRLSWDPNNSGKTRSCTVVLTAESDTVSAPFSQDTGSGQQTEFKSDVLGKWMELPATNNSQLYYFTLPMEIGGKTYRNYSFGWDKDNLVAHWVAYPLNGTLLQGTSGRSEAWKKMQTFPRIPSKYQPNLSGYYQQSSGYVRGHQIPSADRQIQQYNEETFYGINMTPQHSGFNSGTWASCEAFVRTRSRMVDTLYVVTGCIVSPNIGYSYDSVGKKVTRPSAYFKALLAYSKKQTVGKTTGGYAAIAFLFQNALYSGGNFINAAMTVDELEARTGIDFFANLPSAIGSSQAAVVESTNDSWWFN